MAKESDAAKAFRANVRALLDSRGLTISEVASLAGMSRPGLSRVLSGEEGVTLDRAQAVADALGASLPALIRPKKNFENAA